MHANVLSAHPEIVITDEFHDIGLLREHISKTRRGIYLKKFDRETALLRQSMLAQYYWLLASGSRVIEKAARASIVGNKTPQVERNFELYERLFSATPPRYVYCLRNARDVMRSVKNLKNLRWNRDDVQTNMGRYINSVRAYETMRSRFPDRVFLSSIDHLKRSGVPASEFFEPMFEFVGVDVTDEVRLQIDAMSPQNTMDAVRRHTGQQDEVLDLTDEEVEYISSLPEYVEVRDRYRLSK